MVPAQVLARGGSAGTPQCSGTTPPGLTAPATPSLGPCPGSPRRGQGRARRRGGRRTWPGAGRGQDPRAGGRGAGPDLREYPGADPGHGREVTGREGPFGEPEHPGVQHLGLAYVLDDLVAVPAAAAWALAQHRRRRGGGLLEVVPRGFDERGKPFGLLCRAGLAVQRGRDVQGTEVGRRCAGHPFGDLDAVHLADRVEGQAGQGGHHRVPRGRGRQCRERLLLPAAGPAPARPVHGACEHPLAARLQVHARHGHHLPRDDRASVTRAGTPGCARAAPGPAACRGRGGTPIRPSAPRAGRGCAPARPGW